MQTLEQKTLLSSPGYTDDHGVQNCLNFNLAYAPKNGLTVPSMYNHIVQNTLFGPNHKTLIGSVGTM